MGTWRTETTKTSSASAAEGHTTLGRYREMTDEQFDKFCDGLRPWMEKMEGK
tara:strand:+ start:1401 stop:1556 length:156 start_codon:yes stop_codon:yes gene_type:complete